MTTITADGTVEFMFYRPDAKEVLVVGDFTGWTQQPLKMQPAKEGWWSLQVRLVSGDYRFRYLVDSNWYTDFAAHGVEMTKNGVNSVLVIPETAEYTEIQRVRIAA